MTLETPGSPALPPRLQGPQPTSGIVDGHLLVIGASHQDIRPVGQAQHSCLGPGDTQTTGLGLWPDRPLPTQAPLPRTPHTLSRQTAAHQPPCPRASPCCPRNQSTLGGPAPPVTTPSPVGPDPCDLPHFTEPRVSQHWVEIRA